MHASFWLVAPYRKSGSALNTRRDRDIPSKLCSTGEPTKVHEKPVNGKLKKASACWQTPCSCFSISELVGVLNGDESATGICACRS